MHIITYLIHGKVFPMGEDDLIDYLSQYGIATKQGIFAVLSKTPLKSPSVHQEEQPHIRIYHDFLSHTPLLNGLIVLDKGKKAYDRDDLGKAVEDFLNL